MPKLIDADKLKTELSGETSLHNLLASVIDSQPLVDAVPREVINEMITEVENVIDYWGMNNNIAVHGIRQVIYKYCDKENKNGATDNI